MTDDDNWVKSAMDDDDLVVQVLLTLRQQSLPTSHTKSPPIGWNIRQRRSRPQVVLLPSVAKKSPAARASPTTPLSWSGGGATSVSVSGGGGGGGGNGDGTEESSGLIPNRSDVSRSKVIRPNETTPTKRPRKKKTLAELKEDETTLLKERKQLKWQLESLQATCQQQRMENESLKKMKMDLQCEVEGLKEETVGSFAVPDLNIPAAGEE